MSAPQTDARTPRRQVLAVVLLPGLLLAAIYMVSLRLTLARDITALETQVESARAKLPDAATITRQAQELDDVRAQVEVARARKPPEEQPALIVASTADRAQRRLRIGAILAHHALLLVQEELGTLEVGAQVAPPATPPAATATPTATASTSTTATTAPVAASGGSTTPSAPRSLTGTTRNRSSATRRARVQVSTLRLRGGYLDVLGALEEMRDSGLGVVPLNVEMRRDETLLGPDGLADVEWTLVLS